VRQKEEIIELLKGILVDVNEATNDVNSALGSVEQFLYLLTDPQEREYANLLYSRLHSAEARISEAFKVMETLLDAYEPKRD